MPWKQWAYLELVKSAEFQSYIQNQTTPQFANTAQRDAVYTTLPPPRGALCITTDTLSQWVWSGTAWYKSPWGMPWGLLAYQESTANVGPIVGPGNIAGLNFNYQHVAGRRLRVTLDLMLVGNTAANEARAFILQDARQLNYRAVYLPVANRAYSVFASAIFPSDAVNHAYVSQMGISQGAGNVLSQAANGLPATLALEDLGPLPGSAPTLLPGPERPEAELPTYTEGGTA